MARLRARDACEYCLLPTTSVFYVEHIIPPGLWSVYGSGRLAAWRRSLGRGGPDLHRQLRLVVSFLQRAKEDRVVLGSGRGATRFFYRRYDRWPDHFVFLPGSAYLLIEGVSPEGKATEIGLGLNEKRTDGPLGTRHVRIVKGEYPPSWARTAYGI